MTPWLRPFAALFLFASVAFSQEAPKIARVLPPPGTPLAKAAAAKLEADLEFLEKRVPTIADKPAEADVAVLIKAVRYALDFDEFYGDADAKKATALVDLAKERIVALQKGETPWLEDKGPGVLGFRSKIDGSPQPYGIEIPGDLPEAKIPLYVWLHGRGDKETDLHFIANRLAKRGQVQPPGAIVIHPFGRQCLGFKSAGEIDILEAVDDVCERFPIDRDRIVLIGFSMGGAGVWQTAAHFPDRWVAASPGAGFAETARYQNLTPDKYPAIYEQRLWGVYDVPDYVRNLFNFPVVAYSGEKDKQIQAARVMEEAFNAEGRELTHLIGPGMGHQYHPETLADILRRLSDAERKGKDRAPKTVELQTRTLRYPQVAWLKATGLDEHWQDSRISANVTDSGVTLTTKNVSRFEILPGAPIVEAVAEIDGAKLRFSWNPGDARPVAFEKVDGKWQVAGEPQASPGLCKTPGLQGPIDDAFLEPFVVVLPEGKSSDPAVQKWVDEELAHFLDRWRATFRGEAIVLKADELTAQRMQESNLVLWGDPESSRAIRKVVERLPIEWTASTIAIGDAKIDAAGHVPTLIYPNPFAPGKYVVFNSGPTFREADDRTNSRQNPKLPDWAVFDLSTPPDDQFAGRVVAADFFDESWQPKGK